MDRRPDDMYKVGLWIRVSGDTLGIAIVAICSWWG